MLKAPNPVTRETAAGLCHNVCAMVPAARDRTYCLIRCFQSIVDIVNGHFAGIRDAGGLQLLMQLLDDSDCPYGQHVAAMSALAVCALATHNKRVMVQLSVLEGVWRLIGARRELAVEALCCVCSVMMDDMFAPIFAINQLHQMSGLVTTTAQTHQSTSSPSHRSFSNSSPATPSAEPSSYPASTSVSPTF